MKKVRTAWRALMETHAAVLDLLQADMLADSGITPPQYDLLIHLAEAHPGGLRMSELADAVVLSRSRLTRRVDELVDKGWVKRLRTPEDGRGARAVLTTGGLKMCRSARDHHLRSVQRHFLDRLSAPDQEKLVEILGKVLP